MEQGTVRHRAGKISRKATSCRINKIHRQNMPGLIIADFIVNNEIMPLTGHNHIVIAVRPTFDGAIECLGRDSRNRGKEIGLRFLAAKSTAHPANFNCHGM